MEVPPLAELARRRRVVDVMLTAHSVLRDRYAFRGLAIELVALGSSVVLCLLTFVDPTLLRYIGVDGDLARLSIGTAAAVVFLVSLVQMRVDWKARASEHQRSVERLARVKALYRRARQQMAGNHDGLHATLSRVFDEGDSLLESLIPIPDAEFVSLKARHNRKVLLSRMLDRFPGASLQLLTLTIWRRHTTAARRAIAAEREASQE
jgi:hypothetical protein